MYTNDSCIGNVDAGSSIISLTWKCAFSSQESKRVLFRHNGHSGFCYANKIYWTSGLSSRFS